jgi:hypothetical protein
MSENMHDRKTEFFEISSALKDRSDRLLSMDGRAITSCLASLTLMGLALAQGANPESIQLLGFTFHAKHSLLLVIPVVLAALFSFLLLYTAWRGESLYLEMFWKTKVTPAFQLMEAEVARRWGEFEILKERSVILGRIFSDHSSMNFLLSEEFVKIEKLISGDQLNELGVVEVKRQVVEYFEGLLSECDLLSKKYPMIDFKVWRSHVIEIQRAFANHISTIERVNDLKTQAKLLWIDFDQTLRSLKGAMEDPFGWKTLQEKVKRSECEAKAFNEDVKKFLKFKRLGDRGVKLVVAVPAGMLLISVASVIYFRAGELSLLMQAWL